MAVLSELSLQAPLGELTEEQRAQRWRRAILRLTDAFRQASERREELSPVLLEALHSAMERLLMFGEEGDLLALEEWLCEEEEYG